MRQDIYKNGCWTCKKAEENPQYICPKVREHWQDYNQFQKELRRKEREAMKGFKFKECEQCAIRDWIKEFDYLCLNCKLGNSPWGGHGRKNYGRNVRK